MNFFPFLLALFLFFALPSSIFFPRFSPFFAFQLFDLVFFSGPQSGGQSSPKDGPRGRRGGPGPAGRAGRLGSSPTPFAEDLGTVPVISRPHFSCPWGVPKPPSGGSVGAKLPVCSKANPRL